MHLAQTMSLGEIFELYEEVKEKKKGITLIENISLHGLDMADYAYYARMFFCKPSKRTLAKAQQIFNKLGAC